MKVTDAIKILREHDLVLKKIDGEYRVNFREGDEATAYYTNHLPDAVRTGIRMACWAAKASRK